MAETTAEGAAEGVGTRVAKLVAARAELEGDELKKLAEGAAWLWAKAADEACRQGGTGWYRQVTITEREGGVERKTNLTLPFRHRGHPCDGRLQDFGGASGRHAVGGRIGRAADSRSALLRAEK